MFIGVSQLTERGDIYAPSTTSQNFTVTQNGQTLSLASEGFTSVNGHETAVAHFEETGGIPDGAVVQRLPGSFVGKIVATLTATYTDECDESQTISASAQYELEPPGQSDIRLKEDIVDLGITENGFTLYSFRYIGGTETYVGVMAQEVIQTRPDAVVVGDDGYYSVHYELLGLRMVTLDEFLATQARA